MRINLTLMMLAVAACGDFPQLDDTLSDAARDAPFPTLSPVPQEPGLNDDADALLAARMVALQARADEIRQADIAALQ